jgi:protein PhnA
MKAAHRLKSWQVMRHSGMHRRPYFAAKINLLCTRAGVLLMSELPHCPKCNSGYTYMDAGTYICPECAYEWPLTAAPTQGDPVLTIKDANGNVLQDGDTVTVIKDLKIKGSSSVVKVGTKVKNIRLVEGDHDIDCKIDGIGPMMLKSGFVKKV